jgi:hypothetical protein
MARVAQACPARAWRPARAQRDDRLAQKSPACRTRIQAQAAAPAPWQLRHGPDHPARRAWAPFCSATLSDGMHKHQQGPASRGSRAPKEGRNELNLGWGMRKRAGSAWARPGMSLGLVELLERALERCSARWNPRSRAPTYSFASGFKSAAPPAQPPIRADLAGQWRRRAARRRLFRRRRPRRARRCRRRRAAGSRRPPPGSGRPSSRRTPPRPALALARPPVTARHNTAGVGEGGEVVESSRVYGLG